MAEVHSTYPRGACVLYFVRRCTAVLSLLLPASFYCGILLGRQLGPMQSNRGRVAVSRRPGSRTQRCRQRAQSAECRMQDADRLSRQRSIVSDATGDLIAWRCRSGQPARGSTVLIKVRGRGCVVPVAAFAAVAVAAARCSPGSVGLIG